MAERTRLVGNFETATPRWLRERGSSVVAGTRLLGGCENATPRWLSSRGGEGRARSGVSKPHLTLGVLPDVAVRARESPSGVRDRGTNAAGVRTRLLGGCENATLRWLSSRGGEGRARSGVSEPRLSPIVLPDVAVRARESPSGVRDRGTNAAGVRTRLLGGCENATLRWLSSRGGEGRARSGVSEPRLSPIVLPDVAGRARESPSGVRRRGPHVAERAPPGLSESSPADLVPGRHSFASPAGGGDGGI